MKKIKFNLMKILIFTLIVTMLLPVLAACSGSEPYSEGNGDLKVVCTSFPPFDFARQIGGEKITVTILQDNGADIHNYSPTAKTLKAISEADIFICVGGESDKWVSDAVSSAQNPSLKVLYLTEGFELLHAELENHTHGDEHANGKTGDEEHHNAGDEHVWLSLKNAIKISDKICAAFSESDTDNAEYYAAQTAAFKASLTSLDDAYRAAVDGAKSKTVVVADRFPFIYLTNDYGLCYYAAFSGCSTEVNSDFATQIKLINAVKEHSLSAIIVTEGQNKALADNICAETGCKKVVFNSMQSVTRAEIQSGATYVDIMTQNLSSFSEALK